MMGIMKFINHQKEYLKLTQGLFLVHTVENLIKNKILELIR